MLVLTRKVQEQILIGDDIKITLIRCKGNTVRIGIEAPREIRVIRGELERLADTIEAADAQEDDLSDREQAFAHPDNNVHRSVKSLEPDNRLKNQTPALPGDRLAPSSLPQVFVGSVDRNGNGLLLKHAPLARFVAAS